MFQVKGKVSIIRKGKFSFRKQHYGNMISVFLVRTKSPFNCLREIFILETLDVGIGDFRQPSFPCQLTNNSRDTRRALSTLTRGTIFTQQLVRHHQYCIVLTSLLIFHDPSYKFFHLGIHRIGKTTGNVIIYEYVLFSPRTHGNIVTVPAHPY